MSVVISIENLSKRYRLGMIGGGSLRADLERWWAKMRGKPDPLMKLGESLSNVEGEWVWALRRVDLEVKDGQVLGIIGRNGAGKSTLLKLLSRITAPSTGEIRIKGRTGSLLEVGTGFHPELTGRDNVYLNGAILGMSRKEISRKFDEIIDFSGVEPYIDTPIKRYSSGMKVRLAFAVAAHLDPEILIIDEVLAVGDAEFQKKCIGKMEGVAGEGRTVLFVSHNMRVIQRLCPETVLLEGGRVIRRGDSAEVIHHYLSDKTDSSGEYVWNWNGAHEKSELPFVPLKLRLLNHELFVTNRVSSTQPFFVEIEFAITEQLRKVKLGFTLSTGDGELFWVAWNPNDQQLNPGTYVSRCKVPGHQFNHGGFVLGITSRIPGYERLFRDYELLSFHIDDGISLSQLGRSVMRPVLKWKTEAVVDDFT